MEVIFWSTASGDSPIDEFIDAVPIKAKKKILRTLELVQKYGVGVIRSCAKVTGTAFYELKVDFDKIFYRIFFVIVKTACFILHIFKKKTNRTSMRDKNVGQRRYNSLMTLYPAYF